MWRNWTRDQTCEPQVFEQPRDVDEVAAQLKRAADRGMTVRVAGSGHSFTEAVLTDGLLLSLDRMNRVIDIDAESGLVRVDAGITLAALNEVLWEHGLALPNLGDVDVQSIGGAIATGTHGTGGRLANLSSAIESIEIVLADGSVIEADERSDADAWRAGRVSIGALGIVTAVTIRAVPAFALRGVDEPRPLAWVLENFDELVDANDHFEFYTFPQSPLALTRTNNRTDAEPRPRSRVSAWANDIMLNNRAFGVFCRLGRRWPSIIPWLNRTASRLAGRSDRVDRSFEIFTSPRLVRFTEMEYAIPRTQAAEAVQAVRRVADTGGFAIPFPIEVRFAAADDALLSPANGRDSCYIAVHMFEKMPWQGYFACVDEIMAGYEGRPHWGKRHFQTAETLKGLYPEWDRFKSVHRRLDPDGRFANEYVRRVLGS
jgi:L-gulono-1,4-lactone dehydrogenase